MAGRRRARLLGGAQVVHAVEEHPVPDQVHAAAARPRSRTAARVVGSDRASSVDRHDRRPPPVCPCLAREARPPLDVARARRTRSTPGTRRASRPPRAPARRCTGRASSVAGRPRGDRLVARARLPTARGRARHRPAANISAKPLPPSPPVTTVVTRGLRRRRPAELALGVRRRDLARERLVRAGGREALRARIGRSGARRLGARLGRRGPAVAPRRTPVRARRVGDRRREPREQRVGRDDLGHLERALGRPPRALGREVVRRGDADAALRRRRGRGSPCPRGGVLWWIELEANRVSPPHSCMNRTSTPSARGRLRAASATRRTSSGPMRPVIAPPPAFIPPARISRAPRPARPGTSRARRRGRRDATWPGWPLPQFGVPHSVQSSRPPTASHEPQNSVVMPV